MAGYKASSDTSLGFWEKKTFTSNISTGSAWPPSIQKSPKRMKEVGSSSQRTQNTLIINFPFQCKKKKKGRKKLSLWTFFYFFSCCHIASIMNTLQSISNTLNRQNFPYAKHVLIDTNGGIYMVVDNGVYSLKWRLTDRYLRWGTLAGPRPGRADADQCKSSDVLQELRISGFPRFWASPTCFPAK